MWIHRKKGGILFEPFLSPVITNAFRVRETSAEAFYLEGLSLGGDAGDASEGRWWRFFPPRTCDPPHTPPQTRPLHRPASVVAV